MFHRATCRICSPIFSRSIWKIRTHRPAARTKCNGRQSKCDQAACRKRIPVGRICNPSKMHAIRLAVHRHGNSIRRFKRDAGHDFSPSRIPESDFAGIFLAGGGKILTSGLFSFFGRGLWQYLLLPLLSVQKENAQTADSRRKNSDRTFRQFPAFGRPSAKWPPAGPSRRQRPTDLGPVWLRTILEHWGFSRTGKALRGSSK